MVFVKLSWKIFRLCFNASLVLCGQFCDVSHPVCLPSKLLFQQVVVQEERQQRFGATQPWQCS